MKLPRMPLLVFKIVKRQERCRNKTRANKIYTRRKAMYHWCMMESMTSLILYQTPRHTSKHHQTGWSSDKMFGYITMYDRVCSSIISHLALAGPFKRACLYWVFCHHATTKFCALPPSNSGNCGKCAHAYTYSRNFKKLFEGYGSRTYSHGV